ncbi:hypothetical protein GZ77_00940 [Endozoicomonas montiporae]|uniref:Peptidase S54 rhomboid domain-containing protein n=2 Tax=Endozoicomonas montiporae TaxID=1027273 RepID=A0A081N9Z7_9GAMM|nr:rhomboid family intramembrane serine protease [Endozoicomonas montiporae]AMO57062.1 GlpG protein [Endozoicomonas montiporae CL-33]KEQ15270.1 hypothetical protein GZ77_00940 [Endozoicomonas montiporae]
MYRALVIPGDKDLSSLSYFLYRQGLPHKITEEAGQLVIWTASEEQGEVVKQVYSDWDAGLLQLEQAPERRGVNVGGMFKSIPWRRFPITMLFLVACLVVAVFTQLGENIAMVSHFTFVKIKVSGQYAYFASLAHTLDSGEYWRLLSPIFLHFGILHLAFNMLWLFDLGRRIEFRQGGVHLFGIVVVTGLLSNFAQYLFGGDTTIFGGFSGVIYGFLGYCLAREKIDPRCQFGIPPAIYVFMLVWLAIGYTGILGAIGFGNMANAAHSGGLVSGLLIGALAGIFLRKPVGSDT